MKKIKIAHIITKLELGGAQLNTIYTVNFLASKNYDVTLIYGKGGILKHTLIDKNVKTIVLENLIRKINPIKDFFCLLELKKILKNKKFDVIHTHSSKAGILGRLAGKFSKTKFIFHTVHGWGFTPLQNPLIKYIYILLEKICANFTTKIITVAHDNIEKGLKNNISKKEKYTVIRSGIDFKLFDKIMPNENIKKELLIKKDDIIITMIACFKPQKNPIEFIEIANILIKKFKNLKFILIGDGILKNKILNKINEYNIKDNFILAGWKLNIKDYLSITNIFCLTSLWEGLPRAILEAYACKIPVIASSVDGSKEAVINGETGFLYKPYHINDAVKFFEKLILNKNRKQLGINGYNFSHIEFSIEKMLNDILKLYENHINN